MSVDPHPPPEGTMTPKQYDYFTKAVGIGSLVPCTILNCDFLDNYIFCSVPKKGRVPAFLLWNSDFHGDESRVSDEFIFDCQAETTDDAYNLCEIDHVLGEAMKDVNAGRLPHVKYEKAGPENVDVRPYYHLDEDKRMRLDWVRFKNDGFEWTYTRPDTFPRFYSAVSSKRLPGPALGPIDDVLTTKPLDILHLLLPYLTDKSFVSLFSTCRTLRHHALTTFQPQARERVLGSGWAIPLHKEYASIPLATRDAGSVVDPDNIPLEGDWMLYLCNVHKSQSMRARRWIWATAEELRRAFLEQKAGGPYEDIVVGEGSDAQRIKSPKRLKLEKEAKMNPVSLMFPPDW
ncbi:hypothetical protein NM688_g5489 [Phlebia brevispora]|uniref:Uncharacterized protein n=1 Tax=Phlebia brevispora TaxID=194682 RepID=A0ACC1SUP5_9APHY|nr:hypothetical protein NM688_g5489 [Phlebia brevispora]